MNILVDAIITCSYLIKKRDRPHQDAVRKEVILGVSCWKIIQSLQQSPMCLQKTRTKLTVLDDRLYKAKERILEILKDTVSLLFLQNS